LASIHSLTGNQTLAAKSLARAKEQAISFGAAQADLVAQLVQVTEAVSI